MKRVFVAVLVAAIGWSVGVSVAHAAAVDLLVTGKVTVAGIPGGVTSPLAVDDIVTFHLTYDTPSPDADAAANHGNFHPFTTFETSFGGQTFSLAAPSVRFDVTDGATDAVQIRYSDPADPQGFAGADLGFFDPTGVILGSDGLPTLASLQSMAGDFGFFLQPPLTGGPPFPVVITGKITSVAAVAVVATTPIPAALPLLMGALGGLGFVGWRRRRTLTA